MLSRLWKAWKPIAQKIGDFQARVILTLMYFLILGPIALLTKLFRDPLGMKRPPQASVWARKPLEHQGLEAARRQF